MRIILRYELQVSECVFWVRREMSRDQCGKRFGVGFWAKRSTKIRDACGQMDVLDCIGMFVLECAFGSSAKRKDEMLAIEWRFFRLYLA